MWSLLLMFACDGGDAPAETPTPAPAPAPVAVAVDAYTIGPAGGERTTYGPGFETFHGGYGALVAAKASSSLSAQGANRYDVGQLDDDDYRTAWVEGVDGDGIGEWIEFTYTSPEPDWGCGSISIINGYQKSAAAFRDNGRVKALDVFAGGERRGRLEVEDRTGEQFFTVPVARYARVRLVIAEVYPGAKHKDTAITEMWVGCGP
ncbi:MAG: hypothetical protein ACI8S6_000677 [Myxococcota bacterium]|jgi:hypothetical protein